MKKVYQTIIDKGNGNCMQAVIASLFDLDLDQVPHFISYGDLWYSKYHNFLESMGYKDYGFLVNPNRVEFGPEKSKDKFQRIKEMEGVNGYFFASVYSPKYFNASDQCPVTHAVVIDKDFNIVHDPNPNYQLIEYPAKDIVGYNGIVGIYLINRKK